MAFLGVEAQGGAWTLIQGGKGCKVNKSLLARLETGLGERAYIMLIDHISYLFK